jgi:translation initiation factor 2 gamma subunit (eIF-2gamma)
MHSNKVGGMCQLYLAPTPDVPLVCAPQTRFSRSLSFIPFPIHKVPLYTLLNSAYIKNCAIIVYQSRDVILCVHMQSS